MMSWISLFLIWSMMLGRPWWSFITTVESRPFFGHKASRAVGRHDAEAEPRKLPGTWRACGLSFLLTVMSTVPRMGSICCAAASAL
jgi:hypothetical protein